MMKALREYSIPFVGLRDGQHVFQFEVDDSFFKNFEGSQITGSKVLVEVKFDKRSSFFTLEFGIEGTIKTQCDRCLKDIDLEILDEFKVYAKFDDEAKDRGDEEEDIIFISRQDTHLELSQLIYEFINLSVPMQRVCPPKKNGGPGCDEKILKILNNNSTDNTEVDPRWAALKKIK